MQLKTIHFASAGITILHEKRTAENLPFLTAVARESSFRSHLASLKTEEEKTA